MEAEKITPVQKLGANESKPVQERTSTYFSGIVVGEIKPMTVEDLPQETVNEFNQKIRECFPDDPDVAVGRVRYLIPYILQSIDWAKYGLPLEAWQLKYYYQRERFLAKSHLSYDRFLDHQPLLRSIEGLGLAPEPTFEFLLFLRYYFGMRSELRYSAVEQLEMAQKALETLPEGGSASVDINVGGKHFRLTNSEFVRSIILSIDKDGLQSGSFVNDFSEGSSRDKLRAIDYYIVKTLLDFLPIKRQGRRGSQFTQEERNFGLSVLSLTGRLPDLDREGECGRENNATFDKLMRDFKGCKIPFAMELFL